MEWYKHIKFHRNPKRRLKKLTLNKVKEKNFKAKVFYETYGPFVEQIIREYQDQEYLTTTKPDVKFDCYLFYKLLSLIRNQEPWQMGRINGEDKLKVKKPEVKKKIGELLHQHYANLIDQYTLIRNSLVLFEKYDYEISGSLKRKFRQQPDLKGVKSKAQSYLALKLTAELYSKQLAEFSVKGTLIKVIQNLNEEELSWLDNVTEAEIQRSLVTIDRYQENIIKLIQQCHRKVTKHQLKKEYAKTFYSLLKPFLIYSCYQNSTLKTTPLRRDYEIQQLIKNTLHLEFNQMPLIAILNELVDVHLLFREPSILIDKYAALVVFYSEKYKRCSTNFYDELLFKIVTKFPYISFKYEGEDRNGKDSKFKTYFQEIVKNLACELIGKNPPSESLGDKEVFIPHCTPSAGEEEDYSLIIFNDSLAHLSVEDKFIFQLFYWIKLMKATPSVKFLVLLLKNSKIEEELQNEFLTALLKDLGFDITFKSDQEIYNKIAKACRLIKPGTKSVNQLTNPGDLLRKNIKKIDKKFLELVELSFRNIYSIDPGIKFTKIELRFLKNNKSYHQFLMDCLSIIYEDCLEKPKL